MWTNHLRRTRLTVSMLASGIIALAGCASDPPARPAAPAAPVAGPGFMPAPAPPEYVIGPDDVLSISVWRDKDLSGDVVVRPDGKIGLPLINDIQAAGLSTEELRVKLTAALKKYNEDPTVGVAVKQINSRKVFITGQVAKPGPYPLSDHMTVIQLIATAGGLLEYADRENLVLVRGTERRPDGVPWSFKINYDDLVSRRNLYQNIELKPGDTLMVR